LGQVYPAITQQLKSWIEQQHVVFVATAPLDAAHHVNCSPKGMDTFRVLDEHSVCYFDYTGSGAETIAHLQENGRITFMFCAFAGPPKIVRLHGQGEIVARGHAQWEKLTALFDQPVQPRAIIKAKISRVSDSCGFGVPLMDYKAERTSFQNWLADKTEKDLVDYRRETNAKSIDGLKAWEEPV
jgi:hypothetical protein